MAQHEQQRGHPPSNPESYRLKTEVLLSGMVSVYGQTHCRIGVQEDYKPDVSSIDARKKKGSENRSGQDVTGALAMNIQESFVLYMVSNHLS